MELFSKKLFSKKNKEPITVELSEKNKVLRIVIACVLLVVGIGAIGYGVSSLLGIDEGWYEIEVNSSDMHCGNEFVFYYYFDDQNGTSTSEYKRICSLYSELASKAYWIFYADEKADGLYNLGYLNQHVNEEVEVEEELYQALALLSEYGSRALYLAPVYAVYDDLCFVDNEIQAQEFDPSQNADTAAYIAQVISYVVNPDCIDIELLGENRVRLTVSEDYLTFVEENSIDVLLDFSWMKNAFIADYFASKLKAEGYTNGYVASYDGFTRNLDDTGNVYATNVLDRLENSIYSAASLQYSGETALVFLRNYPLSSLDDWYYYSWSSGEITTHYIDASDGYCKSATDNILAYQQGGNCAEMLLQLIPVYVTEDLSHDALDTLAKRGIFTVWCDGATIHTTGDANVLQDIYSDETVTYTIQNAS